MSMMFNAEWGYLEALTRGFKNGMLKHSDYLNLTQCESLEDVMISIQGTDYGLIFGGEKSEPCVEVIEQCLRDRLLQQYSYIRSHSTEPLTTFMEFIRYPFMIDNVALLVAGLNNRRSMKRLLRMCHPLGEFDQLGAIEVATNSAELFDAVLIDTPIARFVPPDLPMESLRYLDVEIVRAHLYRSYLESFYDYCSQLGGNTAGVMTNLLSFEADRRTITIAVNAIGSDINPKDRLKMFPTCGYLPKIALDAMSSLNDAEKIRDVCNVFDGYGKMFDNLERDTDGMITLEDRFLMMEAKKNVQTFLQQYHFGIFYSFIKLKLLECRNIVWISECIAQRQTDRIYAYIPIPLD
ncbi:probable V-type proton ATPase subunit d 2 [Drosophila teissieri]|uniref:probable V-type proton ATPase subunit d 2 n=1 Tax=Drosophila teissieri TaxID=7243 RepID=UPI001CB9EFC2|nr:probable V-type proton ATPase subunit d 2 [Drosophila teissieri]